MVDNNERITRLEREMAELKGKSPSASAMISEAPSPRFDPTAQLRVPDSVAREMTAAVGDKLMADIVRDHLGRPTSLPTVHGRTPGKAGSNWSPERPLPTWGGENFGKKDTPKDS